MAATRSLCAGSVSFASLQPSSRCVVAVAESGRSAVASVTALTTVRTDVHELRRGRCPRRSAGGRCARGRHAAVRRQTGHHGDDVEPHPVGVRLAPAADVRRAIGRRSPRRRTTSGRRSRRPSRARRRPSSGPGAWPRRSRPWRPAPAGQLDREPAVGDDQPAQLAGRCRSRRSARMGGEVRRGSSRPRWRTTNPASTSATCVAVDMSSTSVSVGRVLRRSSGARHGTSAGAAPVSPRLIGTAANSPGSGRASPTAQNPPSAASPTTSRWRSCSAGEAVDEQ